MKQILNTRSCFRLCNQVAYSSHLLPIFTAGAHRRTVTDITSGPGHSVRCGFGIPTWVTRDQMDRWDARMGSLWKFETVFETISQCKDHSWSGFSLLWDSHHESWTPENEFRDHQHGYWCLAIHLYIYYHLIHLLPYCTLWLILII